MICNKLFDCQINESKRCLVNTLNPTSLHLIRIVLPLFHHFTLISGPNSKHSWFKLTLSQNIYCSWNLVELTELQRKMRHTHTHAAWEIWNFNNWFNGSLTNLEYSPENATSDTFFGRGHVLISVVFVIGQPSPISRCVTTNCSNVPVKTTQ